MPAAAALAGVAWEVADLFGPSSNAGSLLIAVLAALAAFGLYKLSRRNNISPEELDRTAITPEIETERAEIAAAAAPA
jgi:hypothetical protein